MTETWCGALLWLLVPLVTALNAFAISQLRRLQQSVDADTPPEDR